MLALIVSDSEVDRFLVSCALKTLNVSRIIELTSFDMSGLELGVEAVKEHSPDIIVCDFGLPGGGGLELLRTIRRQRPGLPCAMLLSSEDHYQFATEIMVEGSCVLIQTPFHASDSLHQLQRLIPLPTH